MVGSESLTLGELQRVRRRAESAYRIVEEQVIARRGIAAENAALALPQDYLLLDGWADCLSYDRAADRFTLAQP